MLQPDMAASLSGTYFTFLVLVVIANAVHILCWNKLHIDGVAILEHSPRTGWQRHLAFSGLADDGCLMGCYASVEVSGILPGPPSAAASRSKASSPQEPEASHKELEEAQAQVIPPRLPGEVPVPLPGWRVACRLSPEDARSRWGSRPRPGGGQPTGFAQLQVSVEPEGPLEFPVQLVPSWVEPAVASLFAGRYEVQRALPRRPWAHQLFEVFDREDGVSRALEVFELSGTEEAQRLTRRLQIEFLDEEGGLFLRSRHAFLGLPSHVGVVEDLHKASLWEELGRCDPSSGRACFVLLEAAAAALRGLQRLHSHNWVMCKVSPESLCLALDGRWKLTGVHAAQKVSELEPSCWGATLLPEVLLELPLTEKSDLWLLGACLCEALLQERIEPGPGGRVERLCGLVEFLGSLPADLVLHHPKREEIFTPEGHLLRRAGPDRLEAIEPLGGLTLLKGDSAPRPKAVLKALKHVPEKAQLLDLLGALLHADPVKRPSSAALARARPTPDEWRSDCEDTAAGPASLEDESMQAKRKEIEGSKETAPLAPANKTVDFNAVPEPEGVSPSTAARKGMGFESAVDLPLTDEEDEPEEEAEGGREAAPSVPLKKSVDFDAVPEPRSSAPSKAARKGTGFVLTSDLPLTDEEDEPDEEAEGGNEAAPSVPPRKSVDFDAAGAGATKQRSVQGTGFVLTADLPLTDEEDEEDEKAEVPSKPAKKNVDFSAAVPEPQGAAPSKATRKGTGFVLAADLPMTDEEDEPDEEDWEFRTAMRLKPYEDAIRAKTRSTSTWKGDKSVDLDDSGSEDGVRYEDSGSVKSATLALPMDESTASAVKVSQIEAYGKRMCGTFVGKERKAAAEQIWKRHHDGDGRFAVPIFETAEGGGTPGGSWLVVLASELYQAAEGAAATASGNREEPPWFRATATGSGGGCPVVHAAALLPVCQLRGGTELYICAAALFERVRMEKQTLYYPGKRRQAREKSHPLRASVEGDHDLAMTGIRATGSDEAPPSRLDPAATATNFGHGPDTTGRHASVLNSLEFQSLLPKRLFKARLRSDVEIPIEEQLGQGDCTPNGAGKELQGTGPSLVVTVSEYQAATALVSTAAIPSIEEEVIVEDTELDDKDVPGVAIQEAERYLFSASELVEKDCLRSYGATEVTHAPLETREAIGCIERHGGAEAKKTFTHLDTSKRSPPPAAAHRSRRVSAEGGNEAAPSVPPKKSVDFDAAGAGATKQRSVQGTGFVLTADLPLTDEEDEEDEKAEVPSKPAKKNVDFSAAVPEPQGAAPSKATRKGTGFVLAADLPLTDEEDEPDEEAEGGNEAAPSVPPKKSVDFDAAGAGATKQRSVQGTGFVLTADLPLTDEEDEEDEKAEVPSKPAKKNVDFSAAVPEPQGAAPSKATRKGTGFVLAADLPLTDEEDEPDEVPKPWNIASKTAKKGKSFVLTEELPLTDEENEEDVKAGGAAKAKRNVVFSAVVFAATKQYTYPTTAHVHAKVWSRLLLGRFNESTSAISIVGRQSTNNSKKDVSTPATKVPESQGSAPSKASRKGTGFVLAADLPLTDEEDELDEAEGSGAVPSAPKKNVGFSAVPEPRSTAPSKAARKGTGFVLTADLKALLPGALEICLTQKNLVKEVLKALLEQMQLQLRTELLLLLVVMVLMMHVAKDEKAETRGALQEEDMIADPEDEAEKEAHGPPGSLGPLVLWSWSAGLWSLVLWSPGLEALAEQLPAALRRARAAEMEAQQLRLAEGLLGEIKQRDAELALLRAAAVARPDAASLPVEAAAPVVLEDDGPLGLEFDRPALTARSGAAKVVINVAPQRTGLAAGDEVISVNGLPRAERSARNLSWEEFDNAMANRPVVLTLELLARQVVPSTLGFSRPASAGKAWETAEVSAAAARELEAAMTDLQEPPPEFFSQDLPFPEDLSTAEAPASATSEAELPEADDAEARNRPFYELVRSSMVEAPQS
ncbi:Serine/threonine-protein kinase ppk5 [Symbiodinium microadriaticum]|uniref:Serine/threonine-protein kinase ppk5 n=2 Tax=Symbiodinium TaxID=2949 RepID=A0A1Q9E7F1_SYMMI|nr:Serine/threonine-protein kinase ppk5 [Symbiodinium microadriaticum]